MIKDYQKLNLIFLGAPGAGKGTIAHEMSVRDHFYQFSTGEMFREEIKNKTPLGLKIVDITSRGQYVSDDITNELVKNKLQKLVLDNQYFILDGYPRTLDQAKFLDSLSFAKIDCVVLLSVDKQTILNRLTNRRVCPKCQATYHLINKPSKDKIHCDIDNATLIQRKDDQSDVIETRLKVYDAQTKPLIDYYTQKKLLISVDASVDSETIYNEIIKKLSNL